MDKELDKLRTKYGDPVLESTYSEYKDKCPIIRRYYRLVLEQRKASKWDTICCEIYAVVAVVLVFLNVFMNLAFTLACAIMMANALYMASSSRITLLWEAHWTDRFYDCIEKYLLEESQK